MCQMKVPIVVYIDKKYLDGVISLCNDKRPEGVFTQVIPIDDGFMKNNIRSWSYILKKRGN